MNNIVREYKSSKNNIQEEILIWNNSDKIYQLLENHNIEQLEIVKVIKRVYQDLNCNQYIEVDDNNPHDDNRRLILSHIKDIEDWLDENEWLLDQLIYSFVHLFGYYMTESEREDDLHDYYNELQSKKLTDSRGIEGGFSWYHHITYPEMEKKLNDIQHKPLINPEIISSIKNNIELYLMSNGYDIDWNLYESTPYHIFIMSLKNTIIEPLVSKL